MAPVAEAPLSTASGLEANGVPKKEAKPRARRGAAIKATATISSTAEGSDAEASAGGSDSELSDLPDLAAVAGTPAKAKAATKRRKSVKGKSNDEEATAKGDAPAPKRRRTKKAKEEDGEAGEEEPKKPRKRKTKAKAEEAEPEGPIVLHTVPTRDFATEGPAWRQGQIFTGRLGFACLNTILRSAKPQSFFSSRTCRIKSMQEKGMEWVFDLAKQNVKDIVPMLEWNAKYGIKFMRLSSEMFPFASHAEYGYSPIEVAGEELKAAGDKAKELGIRCTMHPGQFTQLGSPKPEIIAAGIRELKMHTEILDGMGIGPEGVLIVHGGGTYMDRPATLDRIRDTIQNKLPPHVRARLVLENDEMAYAAEELLPVCEELHVPLVFDFHHDLLRPSAQPPSELIPRINKIWARRGIKPKYHLSEPRPGARNHRERRAHSDRCMHLPEDLPADADLMIEAKDKEQAVFELMRIYGLVDVEKIERVVRLPSGLELQGMRGAGKKGVTVKKDYANGNAADAAGEEGTSPKKKAETQSEMANRVLKKAREIAKKKGIQYTGPGARVKLPGEEDDGDESNQTPRDKDPKSKFNAEEVYLDMFKRAEEIRAHLRATGGKERLKYDGNGIEGEKEDLVDDMMDGEDSAPAESAPVSLPNDVVEKVVGIPPPGSAPIGGEVDQVKVVA